jgi:hypothetical protein
MTEHTDEQLLAMAMANLGEYMHDNSPHYVLIKDDPRNDEDYDTWEVGMGTITLRPYLAFYITRYRCKSKYWRYGGIGRRYALKMR